MRTIENAKAHISSHAIFLIKSIDGPEAETETIENKIKNIPIETFENLCFTTPAL